MFLLRFSNKVVSHIEEKAMSLSVLNGLKDGLNFNPSFCHLSPFHLK